MSENNAVVGIRVHNLACLPKLTKALWSCVGQDYDDVRVVIACQGFGEQDLNAVRSLCEKVLHIDDVEFDIINVPNPEDRDLRSALLNAIIDHAYSNRDTRYLQFLDYDDVLFSHAVSTLVDALDRAGASLAYGSIQAANIWDFEEFDFLLDLKDLYQMGRKTKLDLAHGNFLPLHSYMFDLKYIERSDLAYDEDLVRTEDYDLLLRLATKYPWTPLASHRLIGMYMFYSQPDGDGALRSPNTSPNPFYDRSTDGADVWDRDLALIRSKHGHLSPKMFYSDYWR